jgi:hypothetical protein
MRLMIYAKEIYTFNRALPTLKGHYHEKIEWELLYILDWEEQNTHFKFQITIEKKIIFAHIFGILYLVSRTL